MKTAKRGLLVLFSALAVNLCTRISVSDDPTKNEFAEDPNAYIIAINDGKIQIPLPNDMIVDTTKSQQQALNRGGSHRIPYLLITD